MVFINNISAGVPSGRSDQCPNFRDLDFWRICDSTQAAPLDIGNSVPDRYNIPMNPAIHPIVPAAEFFTDERCHVLELSNFADDPDCSIAQARVEPGVTTRLHRLAGVAERYVILEGRGRIEIGGLPPQDVGPGDVAIIPPGTTQRIANVGAGDLVFLAICTPRFRPETYAAAET